MKQNLLLLHGALGSKNQFDILQRKLSGNFKVHVLDFEGHGERPSDKEFSMHLFVNNVIQYLRENEIKKTHLFGFSMGGYVALNVAKEFPASVNKVVTLGTKFNWTKEIAEREMQLLKPEVIEEKVPAFANKLATIHVNNDWKKVVEKTANMMQRLASKEKLTWQDLQEINHNTLICVGDKDETVSIQESEKSAKLLPNGELRVINDLKHTIEKINADAIRVLLIDFLNND